MNGYTKEEESLIKTEYLRLKNSDPESSVYSEISNILHTKGYDRSAEAVRKKVDRMGLPPLRANDGIRKAIIIPDMHVPYHDKKATNLVEQYMRDGSWDLYINLGDLLDLDQISHHNDRKPRIKEGKRLEEDFQAGREILQRHRDIVGEDCEMYYLQGNHEERCQRYLDQNPQHEGLMEIPVRLKLDEIDVNWLKYYREGETLTVGECTFLHGRYTNKYHAKKHCQRYMTNVVFGHVHDVQCFSIETQSSEHVYQGQSLGCLCEYDQQYKRGEPDNWQHAFGVAHFFPDGNFNLYPVRIFDYKFISPEGEVYKCK